MAFYVGATLHSGSLAAGADPPTGDTMTPEQMMAGRLGEKLGLPPEAALVDILKAAIKRLQPKPPPTAGTSAPRMEAASMTANLGTYQRRKIINAAIAEHASTGQKCSQKAYITVCLEEANEPPLSDQEVELHCGVDPPRPGEQLHCASCASRESSRRRGHVDHSTRQPPPWFVKPRAGIPHASATS